MKRLVWPELLRLVDLLLTLDAKEKAEQAQPTAKVLKMPKRTAYQPRDRRKISRAPDGNG